ncbi:MAG: InlB B-repeat-containing protein [Candidatus Bathyarchaeia archaeon]|jgi:uncharacterized repeat protein (TIGR02543 family)
MLLGARKVSLILISVLLISASVSVLATVAAYYPLSQNTLFLKVNYPGGYTQPYQGTYNYYYGEVVTVHAYSYQGYVFDGWYLNGQYQGKLTTIQVTMNQDYELIAQFSTRTACLTVTTNPSQSGTTVPAPGLSTYTYGSMVTVKEYPGEGCTFGGWYLDGTYQGLGTSILVNMSQDHQVSAFFSGTPTNITTTPTPSPTPLPTPNATAVPSYLPTPALSFYCTSSPTSTGFRVLVQGALMYNQTALSGAGVAFEYSVNGGTSWHDLAYLITDDYGNFSAVWMPSASGNYAIRGHWHGDSAYAPVTSAINFSITPSDNQNSFSVSSNSTLSSLIFDSTQNTLGFTVSGPSGTAGYVQACIPNTLMATTANLEVTLDGAEVPFYSFLQGNLWIVTIEYHHSSHSVVMHLDEVAASSTPTSNPTQQSSPTSNPTTQPTSNPTTSPTPTPTVPEVTAMIVLPLMASMVSAAILLKHRKKVKSANTE